MSLRTIEQFSQVYIGVSAVFPGVQEREPLNEG
jgi:hypothetical protein